MNVLRKLAPVLLLVVVLLLAVGPAVAASVIPDNCVDAAVVGGFTLCFIGKTDNEDNTSTWTYAIQTDGDPSTPALSHWSLQLCTAASPYVDPGNGETYVTPASVSGFQGREGIEYTVVLGSDPTTGVSGIKWEDGAPNLGENGPVETDIHQFTMPTQNIAIGETTFGIKAAGSYTDTIQGPVFQEGANVTPGSGAPLITQCEVPSTVSLVSFRATRFAFPTWLLRFFGLR
ncbi:MAG: hypothetical protein ACP5JG_18865 [Anaerolineae bacterium]